MKGSSLAEVGAKLQKKPAPADVELDEDDDGIAGAAIDELFDAVKSGDRDAFASAFRAAVGSCK